MSNQHNRKKGFKKIDISQIEDNKTYNLTELARLCKHDYRTMRRRVWADIHNLNIMKTRKTKKKGTIEAKEYHIKGVNFKEWAKYWNNLG